MPVAREVLSESKSDDDLKRIPAAVLSISGAEEDNPTKVLLVEDNPGDTRLIREKLKEPVIEAL